MASKPLCPKYQYVVTPNGPQILPFDQPSCKDEESPADYNAGGYLPVKVNDTFKQGRYRVVRKLGWGHFSTVWLVKDSQTSAHSALKVVKSAGRYAETARDEIKLLSKVASVSPSHPGRSHIVSFLDSFSHQSPDSAHICIVFEPLGENLLALIERNKKKGVPRPLVKVIAKQILLGLQYLHDECDLVHTDIKPENILISIPDIEEHIHQELSQSPSPTSRRVGVPLPGKSKAGVTIPYNQQQRARRQVQIFDSQPLSSPSRSVVRSLGRNVNGGHSNILMSSSRAPASANTHASQSNSYVTQMNLLRNSSRGLPSHTSFIGGSFGSSVPKVHSNLAASFPMPYHHSPSTATKQAEPSPLNDNNAPSTASSSSSISSAAVSTPAGGSIISTPPTSLSQSMTSSGFLNKIDPKGLYKVDELTDACPNSIPIQLRPGKDRDGPSPGSSLSKTASWVDQAPCSVSSSYKGSPLKSSKPRCSRHGHSHSQSGMGNAPWQDPGVAQPAPVVLVNAVVGADGQDSGVGIVPTLHTSSSSTSTITRSHSASGSSSTAATITQPSPTGTPLGSRKTKGMSLINGVSKLISDTSNIFSGGLHSGSDWKPPSSPGITEALTASTSIANPVSLLTQTAPTRITTTATSPPKRTSLPRASPPQHTSQLSAHMHPEPCHSLTSGSGLADPTQRLATSSQRSSRLNLTTAIPMYRHDVSPAPPPPTPIDGPQLGSFSTHECATLPSIDTSGRSHVPSPPPISIKIADLGNATPSKKHYTEDIQTRQYRAPEAIVGRKDWDARADIWSVACLIFELLAAEYLFDPQGQGELFTKDDDHMAQIIELVGDFSLDVKMGGKYSRELFDHSGALRYIKTLKPWPLKRVMTEKYLYSEEDADGLCAFLLPMLKADWRERAHARVMLDHPWLDISNEEEIAEW